MQKFQVEQEYAIGILRNRFHFPIIIGGSA